MMLTFTDSRCIACFIRNFFQFGFQNTLSTLATTIFTWKRLFSIKVFTWINNIFSTCLRRAYLFCIIWLLLFSGKTISKTLKLMNELKKSGKWSDTIPVRRHNNVYGMYAPITSISRYDIYTTREFGNTKHWGRHTEGIRADDKSIFS